MQFIANANTAHPSIRLLPLFATSPRRIPKSRYTFKQLGQLKSYSTTTPLRVIAHIDLDAFYAQCETIRLGIDPTKPLAVQQWQGLIAINYPARAFGLSRHVTSTDALKQCPELILQHVATWKEGDEKWAYHEEAYKHIATHKVSLDPYRLESRKILKCIKEALPEKEQRVEKAGIDEVFVDLSAQVHRILLERYPELRGPAPYDDLTEYLPRPPTTVLDWKVDALVETGEDDGEDRDPDWDDVCMVLASEIVRDVRQAVFDTLGYTCSAGVARNKMLSKLGSGYKKPNQQTVIRNRAVKHFLSDMKFTKIRMLGGKLGDEAVAMFGTDTVKGLLEQPLEQLKKLGDDTGTWMYSTIRGDDSSEVNPRTQIKSMLSAKSFRPTINSFEQAVRWLRIFAADIFSRCVEEGVLENKRRPKTINLHHRQGGQTKSRSSSIPQGKPLSETMLFDLAKNLLAQVVVDGRAWPCANLSLSVAGFEDCVTGNKGIGSFLVRGNEAKAMMAGGRSAIDSSIGAPAAKRRKIGNIASFFGPQDEKKKDFDAARAVLKAHRESTREEEESSDDEPDNDNDVFQSPYDDDIGDLPNHTTRPSTPDLQPTSAQTPHHTHRGPSPKVPDQPSHHPPRIHQPTLATFFCPRCNAHLPLTEQPEHEDFHYAMDLSKEMRQEARTSTTLMVAGRKNSHDKKPGRGRGRPPGNGGAKGAGSNGRGGGAQAKLAFGRSG
ncbi:sister chromatid cohesion protein Eso1 [Dendryphion nanum]|uniref:DNA polymerase eta n=1 Tax=Dendryphion nanum TaxID=256645 RepID=A0A9P9D515_9PLEO|nr:sister chromatid cohesion protein Eso1 [Dendryphion nanum]